VCNRIRPASVVRVRDLFGFTYIESGPPRPYRAAIGPLQDGPFIRSDGLAIGQWGLIPEDSPTRIPVRRDGARMSTNNARWDMAKGMPEKFTFKPAWWSDRRCLIPAEDFDEPYWGTGRNVWWRFARTDGEPWMIAGLWNEWTDPSSGEVVLSYTMLTINCDAHPLLKLMHKPDPKLPPDGQDKRTVVPIERKDWNAWLAGTKEEAAALIKLPSIDLFRHSPADPAVQMQLPM
jgi:putative SOS response-associated peptidase YedK